MNEAAWIDLLPEVLSFDSEPDLIVGDLIVFQFRNVSITAAEIEWAHSTQNGPDPVKVPSGTPARSPAVYLRIDAVRRNPKGRWIAEYTACGIEDPAFMAKTTGKITASSMSIDPEAELMNPPDTKESRYVEIRELKAKREQLAGERAGHRSRLLKTASPISRRLIPAMIKGLDRQIAELDRQIDSEQIAA
jgi:hypothetical protein